MSNKQKLESIIDSIKSASMYMYSPAEDKDVERLDIYRIFLNSKIIEAVRVKEKIRSEKKR